MVERGAEGCILKQGFFAVSAKLSFARERGREERRESILSSGEDLGL